MPFVVYDSSVAGLLWRLLYARHVGGLSSFLLLYKRVGDLFAAVDGRDDDEKGATGDDEAKLAVPYVAFVVYIDSVQESVPELVKLTSHGLLDLIQNKIHQLIVALQGSDD